ncbi:MAG: hypothetical protein SFU83_23410 [Meiothermus sp.]|nr:hypothetical protein [Meiothermus sp.]
MKTSRTIAIGIAVVMLGVLGAGQAASRTGSICILSPNVVKAGGFLGATGLTHIAALPSECRPIRR